MPITTHNPQAVNQWELIRLNNKAAFPLATVIVKVRDHSAAPACLFALSSRSLTLICIEPKVHEPCVDGAKAKTGSNVL